MVSSLAGADISMHFSICELHSLSIIHVALLVIEVMDVQIKACDMQMRNNVSFVMDFIVNVNWGLSTGVQEFV